MPLNVTVLKLLFFVTDGYVPLSNYIFSMRVLPFSVRARVCVISDRAYLRRPGWPPPNAPAEAETGSVQCDAGADCSIQHGLYR